MLKNEYLLCILKKLNNEFHMECFDENLANNNVSWYSDMQSCSFSRSFSLFFSSWSSFFLFIFWPTVCDGQSSLPFLRTLLSYITISCNADLIGYCLIAQEHNRTCFPTRTPNINEWCARGSTIKINESANISFIFKTLNWRNFLAMLSAYWTRLQDKTDLSIKCETCSNEEGRDIKQITTVFMHLKRIPQGKSGTAR